MRKRNMKNIAGIINNNIVFVKYVIAGLISTIADLLLMYFLYGVFNISLPVATSVAYLLSFVVSFVLQKFWAFRDSKQKGLLKQIIQYSIVVLINAGLNVYLVEKLVWDFGIWYMSAQIIVCGILALISFFVYRFIIFNKKEYWKKELRNILVPAAFFHPDLGMEADYAMRLCRQLSGMGCNLRVVSFSDEKPRKCRKKKNAAYTQYRISRKQGFLWRHFLFFKKVWRHIAWSDIIYLQGPLCEGIVSYVVCLISRREYFLRVSNDFAWEYAWRKYGVRDSLEDFQKKTYPLEIEVLRFLERIVARGAKFSIVPDQSMKNLLTLWGVAEQKIKIIKTPANELLNLLRAREVNF